MPLAPGARPEQAPGKPGESLKRGKRCLPTIVRNLVRWSPGELAGMACMAHIAFMDA